jgi:hypothetical protein
MSLLGIVAIGLFVCWLGPKIVECILRTDHRDHPVYKKNLQRLIERNRMFEEKRNEPRS